MAYFGLRYPVIAKNTAGTYSDGFICGKAVSVEVAPVYVEGSLFGDDEQAEYEKSFQNATVTLGTTTLPVAANSVMFGHTVAAADSEITYAATDEPSYVGVGYVVDQMVDGVIAYIAQIIKKVKFAEPTDSFTTKGDSITFGTPSLAGTAIADTDGKWKITKQFATASEAFAYVKTTLGITAS